MPLEYNYKLKFYHRQAGERGAIIFSIFSTQKRLRLYSRFPPRRTLRAQAPGSCSRSAPPHGPTPRTTTARRAQPFSASDLRRSSSTFRPIAACVIACRPPARSTPAIGPSAWCKDPGATSIVPSLAPPIAPSEHHSESASRGCDTRPLGMAVATWRHLVGSTTRIANSVQP